MEDLQNSQQQLFRIVHFNDVYDIQPSEQEPVGGVARFKTALDSFRNPNTLVLFSGDAFSPCMLANIHQGEHMIKPLNAFGIDVACLGNHDLDFPLTQVMRLKKSTNFPWVLSNVFDKCTGRRIAEAQEYVVLNRGGLKIGIFGLAERQWLDVLIEDYDGRCQYIDFVEYGQLMVNVLRRDQGCDIVIALTHMMGYNDFKLAEKVTGIDFILGGHDHTIRSQKVNGTILIKSGTNFKTMSILSVKKACPVVHTDFQIGDKKYGVTHRLREITNLFRADSDLEAHVDSLYTQLMLKQAEIVCMTSKQIDIRFSQIRNRENSFIRMLARWYRKNVECDIAMVASGNIRSDTVIKPGPIINSVYSNVIEDQVVTKKVNSQQIKLLLENSVAMYPNLAGRFSSMDGVSFTWDSKKPAFERVIAQSIRVNGELLQKDRSYVVCTHAFHATGGDGFSHLKQAPFVLSPKQGLKNTDIISRLVDLNDPRVKEFVEENSRELGYGQWEGQQLVCFNLDESYTTILMI